MKTVFAMTALTLAAATMPALAKGVVVNQAITEPEVLGA